MSEIDLRKLDIAITYTQRIADGKNPVTNQNCPSDSVMNNPNVIRCMFFIRDILQEVRNNGGIISAKTTKQKVSFPVEVLSGYSYQGDQSITHFLNQLKQLCPDPSAVKLSTKPFTDWLKQNEYLADKVDKMTGEKSTVTTPAGEAFGLYMEERFSSLGRQYNVIMYSRAAQEQLVEHFGEIISSCQ